MAKIGGEGGSPIGGGDGTAAETHDTPVSEELLWKARAEQALEELGALRERVSELEGELSEANEALEASDRRREIERQLVESDALDLEACSLLTEAAVAQMDEPDVSLAVRELRRRKPFLFGGSGSLTRGATMAPAGGGSRDELDGMAARARSSNDRAALLRYLRCRRG